MSFTKEGNCYLHYMPERIQHLQELLDAPNSNNSIIELDNFIGEACGYGEHFERLSPAQRSFYLNQCLEREVNNGGFEQFFGNSSGAHAHETIASLQEIGAKHTAGLLIEAIAEFPGSIVPKDDAARAELIEALTAHSSGNWNALDQEFFKYSDDLNELNIAFVKKNRHQF